jgi:hypothetical protein
MVAEPVQATWKALNYYYNWTSDFVATQQDKVVNSEYFDKLPELNPFSTSKPDPKIIARKPPLSIYTKLSDHVCRNKIQYVSVFSIGIGTGSYYYYNNIYKSTQQQKSIKFKRRVPKLANGARGDVVLIVGSPTEPLTRLIALDFEKRGFVVYLTILDEKDFKYIESNQITEDINYLNLNESYSFEVQISKFRQLLEIPVVPFPGADSHYLRLTSVIFAPSLYFPIGPIENITVASWNKMNERFSTYLKLFSSGLVNLIRSQQSKIILINANIISCLDMPYHAPETIFLNSVRHLFTALSRELSQHNISVTQIRLGNLNISNQDGASESKIATIVNSEIRSWNEDIKELYASNFSSSQYKANPIKSTGRGTSLRQLYHLMFDLIYAKGKNPPVVYCGTGARIYDWVSKIIPESILAWFLT